jgi:hypothetical protein
MSVSLNGTNGLTFNDASTQNTSAFYGGLAFRNRIINGAMGISQRSTASFTQTTAVQYTLDRWFAYGSVASKFTVQQNAGSVTPPAGFINYLGVTSSSAYSISSTDLFQIVQRVEGLNISDFAWGTASAASVTLSFWVRSSLTGTFGGSIGNSAYTRSYPFSYTISSANTWEQKSVTIAGDTSGTWLTTNGVGLYISIGLGVGSTYSGTAGAWAGTEYDSATGATSVVGTNGATFYITGVQLEKGSTATSFDYRPYSTELQLAQRYCIVYGGDSVYNKFATGGTAASTTSMLAFTTFPVKMRATPAFAYAGSWAASNGVTSQTLSNIVISATESSTLIAKVIGTSTAMTALIPYFIEAINSTASTATFSSEL